MVDLDDQTFILYNYVMEDLSNPTIVKSSFSKQIVLKGSPINNKIFGDIFRVDRMTLFGAKYLGAYFDPTRRTPFTIYNEMNEIVESGYVKLDNVVRDGVSIEYHITLYGGLGSFFYGLMYDESGNKRTLADMSYLNGETGEWSSSYNCIGGFTPNEVYQGWEYLQYGGQWDRWQSTEFKFWNVLNFAPVYSGLPENFSSDKAVESGRFKNVPISQYLDGVQYGVKFGTESRLLTFAHQHDMWTMRDLRWYLLKPIISVKGILDAICNPINNGGYNVSISDKIPYELIHNGWMTLPSIPYEERKRSDIFNYLLSNAMSPAEFLISFAKIFGLKFLVDAHTKKVSVLMRNEFFNSEIIDLTDRINKSNLKIQPVVASSRYYQLGSSVIGEYASDYKSTYGVEYGIQKIDTGNEFNNDTSVLTKDISFKEAADVQERNLLFSSIDYGVEDGVFKEWLTLPKYESVKVQLWGKSSGEAEQSMEEFDIKVSPAAFTFSIVANPADPPTDWLPKVQLHNAQGKAADSTGVLLLFNGIKSCPGDNEDMFFYRISDDTEDMMVLNEETPTWNFTDTNVVKINTIPSFRRTLTSTNAGTEYPSATWEWGVPKERAIKDFAEGTKPTIYNLYWKTYLQDRYDNDTFRMSCKANLKGLSVGDELLRKFFYFQGAIFVLNQISNHSLTTWDDTECEFIKVQDINNYIK